MNTGTYIVRIKISKCDPPYPFLIITVHCIIRISLPVAEITQKIAISLAFSIVITVIKNEGNAAISIVIDTVMHSFRKRSLDTITIVGDSYEIAGKEGEFKTAESLTFQKKNIFIDWSKSAEEIEKIVKVCKENGIKIGDKVKVFVRNKVQELEITDFVETSFFNGIYTTKTLIFDDVLYLLAYLLGDDPSVLLHHGRNAD